jgi:hypothetical protein
MKRVKATAVAFALGAAIVLFGMGQITVPNTFVTGTAISSSAMNANFDEIESKALNRTGGTLTGNLTVSNGITIDGRDISADLDQAVKTTSTPTFSTLTTTTTATAGTYLVGTSGVKERGRLPAMGEWITVPHTAGDFTASSGSWTVDGADLSVAEYTLVGKTMTFSALINSSDVSSATATLQVLIPGSKVAASTMSANGHYLDAGGTSGSCLVYVAASGTQVVVQKHDGADWTSTTGDNTNIWFTITFAIQ